MTDLEDPTIKLIDQVHRIAAESKELEDMITESLPKVRTFDPDGDLGLIAFNLKLLKTLMTQRTLMTQFFEHSLEVEDRLEKIVCKFETLRDMK